jgi:hypothetical protein
VMEAKPHFQAKRISVNSDLRGPCPVTFCPYLSDSKLGLHCRVENAARFLYAHAECRENGLSRELRSH